MMNILQLQDRLKGLSQEQLIREMQAPSGSAPQYLVLSEITRRKKMQDELAAQQTKGPQMTVAQEAVAAAGMPQAGLPALAQAMAPKTDVVGNTGVMPMPTPMPSEAPVGMADGGYVRKMFDGGSPPGSNTFRDLLATDPATMVMANRMGMSVGDYLDTLSPEVINANAARVIKAQERAALGVSDVFDPTKSVYSQAGYGELSETPAQAFANTAEQLLEGSGVNPSYTENQPDRFPSLLDFEPTGPAVPPRAPRPQLPPGPTFGDAVSELGSLGLAAAKAFPGAVYDAFAEDRSLPGFRPGNDITSRRGRPGFRPGDEVKIAGYGDKSLDDLRAIIADPNSSPGEKASAQTRLSVAEGVGSVLQGTGDFLAEPVGPEGNLPLDILATTAALTGRAGNYPIELIGRGVSLAAPEAGAAILDWTEANKAAYDRWTKAFDRDQAFLDARASAEEAAAFRDAAGITESLKTPEEVAAAAEAAKDAVRATRKDTSTEDTKTTTPPDGPDGGSTRTSGGAGAGGAGAGGVSGMSSFEQEIMDAIARSEKRAEQDKWLALAQAGLEIMNAGARQGTFAGAVGEGAAKGVAAFREGRDSAEETRLGLLKALEDSRMARAQLAARGGGGGGGGAMKVPTALITQTLAERDAAQQALDMLGPIPGGFLGFGGGDSAEAAAERLRLKNVIRRKEGQLQYMYATQGAPYVSPYANTGGGLIEGLSD